MVCAIKKEVNQVKQRKSIHSCSSCTIDGKKDKEQGKIRKWTANICPGHIGLFLTAVMILIMQVLQG